MISYNNSAPKAVNNVGQFGATEGSIGAYKSAAEYASDAKYWALLSQTKYSSVEDILAEVERLYAQGYLLEEDIKQLKSDFESQEQVLLGLIQSTGTAIDNTNAATELSKEATQNVLAQLDIISNMTVQTTLLPPGSLATGSYDNLTGEFSFGIPEGKPGRDGTDGTISDIGSVPIGTPVTDDFGFYVDQDDGGLYRANMSDIANLVPSIRSISINGGAEQTGTVSFNSVSSFNTRTGDVVSQTGDYEVSQITGAAASGDNSDITSLSGLTTAISVSQGGTGATSAENARVNLGLGSVSVENVTPLTKGGTGATTPSGARSNLGLGLVSTESIVPITKGGTGATSAENARLALVAAKSGANSDITSMTNSVTFTQPISIADGVSATNAVNLGQISSNQGASLIGVKQPFTNTVARTQYDKNAEMISIRDFHQSTDPDWTLAFNRASTVSAQQGKIIFVPAGEYKISDSILLYDSEDVYNEKYYQPPGSRFVGEGRASIIRKTAVGTQDINAVFYNKGKRGNVVRGLRILDETTDSYGYYTPNTAVYQEFSDLFILAQKWGMYFGGNTFVGVSLREIVVQGSNATGIYGGIHIHGGTSYVVSQCNVFKANYCSFELTGSYCEVGPLASDDCTGTPYIFNAGSYSVSSLGCEQPSRQNSGTIIKGTGANLQIDNIHLYDQTQIAGSYMFDLSGYAKVSIKQLITSSTTTFNGAMARLNNGAKLEIVYSNKVETSWPQRNSYDTTTTTFATLGSLGGVATIPTFGTTMCRDIALPNPNQENGPYYRIVGGQYGTRGCIGTIFTLRSGTGMTPIAGAYNLNTVSSNTATNAKLVKAAHCDTEALKDYDKWFTGTYEGTSYLFIRMPIEGGDRNLGTFFSGVVFGQDRNMFKTLLGSEISGLTEYSSGSILTAQAT
nr:MAG TPA: tail protein [Caudoviricetes sp.]